MLQNQEIFIQESKALKNRTIDIICRGSLIPNTSVLNKYYQKKSITQACNDKQSMAEVGRYYMSARDERHSRIGSIFGVQLMFSNNAELFVEGVMVVSTYGKKFVPSNDINKINQLKRLVIDDLLPSYQRMLETEMGMLYLRHLDSESCLQQRQHWGQRLHRKNKELWKKR